MRHLFDYHSAGRLEPDSEGVTVVADLARMLGDMKLRSVAYIPPSNLEMVGKFLGADAPPHVVRNAAIMADTYGDACGELGSVVDATSGMPQQGFHDPIHLNMIGRRRLAAQIAEAVRPHLEAEGVGLRPLVPSAS